MTNMVVAMDTVHCIASILWSPWSSLRCFFTFSVLWERCDITAVYLVNHFYVSCSEPGGDRRGWRTERSQRVWMILKGESCCEPQFLFDRFLFHRFISCLSFKAYFLLKVTARFLWPTTSQMGPCLFLFFCYRLQLYKVVWSSRRLNPHLEPSS